MIPDAELFLSIPQLRISLNLLGFSHWDDLPLVATQEPAEQRIMNSFLKLAQQNYLISAENGFQFDESFAHFVRIIGEADRVWQITSGNLIRAFLYSSGSQSAAITPDTGRPDHIRISCWENSTAEAVCGFLVESGLVAESFRMLQIPQTRPEDTGNDIEKLSLFFQSIAERDISE